MCRSASTETMPRRTACERQDRERLSNPELGSALLSRLR
jgi:hypothetical protein